MRHSLPSSLDALVGRLASLSARIRNLERSEGGTTNLTNNSGLTVSPGDVMVIDPTLADAVTYAAGAGAQGPTVVVIGGEAEALVKCTKRGYGKIAVTCEGAAIAPGDAIVTGVTAGRGQVDNAATGRNLIGFALGEKDVGVVRDIVVLI